MNPWMSRTSPWAKWYARRTSASVSVVIVIPTSVARLIPREVTTHHRIPAIRAHPSDHHHDAMDPAPAPYAIRVDGPLRALLLSAFPAMAARQQGAHTVLTGLLDQSALHGVLAGLEALGLDLVEVRQLGRPTERE